MLYCDVQLAVLCIKDLQSSPSCTGTKIVDSGISIVPEYTLSDRVLRESSVSHTDQKVCAYYVCA